MLKIKQVKVLDSNGNFIRFADIKSLGPHIHKYYITFGRRTESPDKTNTTACEGWVLCYKIISENYRIYKHL